MICWSLGFGLQEEFHVQAAAPKQDEAPRISKTPHNAAPARCLRKGNGLELGAPVIRLHSFMPKP